MIREPAQPHSSTSEDPNFRLPNFGYHHPTSGTCLIAGKLGPTQDDDDFLCTTALKHVLIGARHAPLNLKVFEYVGADIEVMTRKANSAANTPPSVDKLLRHS
jgi:hypothetical protein